MKIHNILCQGLFFSIRENFLLSKILIFHLHFITRDKSHLRHFSQKKKTIREFPALIYLTSLQNIQHKIKGKLFTPVIALQFSVFLHLIIYFDFPFFFLFVVFCFPFFFCENICGKCIFFDFIFQFKRKPYKFKLKAIAPNNPHQLPSVIKINTKAQTLNLFFFIMWTTKTSNTTFYLFIFIIFTDEW